MAQAQTLGHLNHADVQLLKQRVIAIGTEFAAERGLDPASVDHELGFIWAHLAAAAGVLGEPYLAWLDAHKPGTCGGADGGLVPTAHLQPTSPPAPADGYDPRDDDGG